MAYSPPNPNGQATSANSAPVVIASDQSSVRTRLAAIQAPTTGTITTNTSTVTATDLVGVGSVTVTIYGTYAGVNATFEAYDGVNWIVVPFQQISSVTPSVLIATGVLTANSTTAWNVSPLLGFTQFRVRATAYTSGTANVIIDPSAQFVQYLTNVATMPAITSSSLTPGTAAANLGKARDGAAGATDTGVALLYIRRDTPTALTPVAGDYETPQIDQHGATWVREKTSATSAVTSVASSATNVTVLALNAGRKGATIHNDSTSILYLKLGATASATSFTVKMQPDAYYEVPAQYSGIIDGIWASANGSARVTELTS